MTQLTEPTGAALGDFEELSARLEACNGDRTLVDNSPNGFILSLLSRFDLPAPLAAKASFVVPVISPYDSMTYEVPMVSSAQYCIRQAVHRDYDLIRIVVTCPFRSTDNAPSILSSSDVLSSPARWETFPSGPQAVIDEPDEPTKGSDDVVDTVRRLQSHLGLPLRDVLSAAKISRSSFFLWEGNRRIHPRVASQGRLWELAQFVEDLDETVDGNIANWLLTTTSRRRLFKSSEFSQLLQEAEGT